MSHLLNRSLHLSVGSRSVQGILRPVWSRKKVLARARHSFGPSTLDIDVSIPEGTPEETYLEAFEAVVSELDASASTRMAHLVVEFADSRVHYDVVTGDFATASDRQLDAIAKACVAEVLSDRSARQSIRWQLQPDGRHLLISSIETDDIEAIVNTASRLQLNIKSLQPDFCSQWNVHAGRLAGGSGVFAIVCGTHLLAAYAHKGSIAALTCGPWRQDSDLLTTDPLSHPVDDRVNRLIASIGEDFKQISTFLLISPDQPPSHMSTRWSVIRAAEEVA